MDDNKEKVRQLDLEDFPAEQEILSKGKTPAERVRANIASAVNSSIKAPAEIGMEKMGFVPEEKEPTDMIPVIKMEYWDGSKFIIRTDKAGYKKILCRLRVKMRSKLLDLPIEEQIEIARSQNMVKRTEEMMSEKEYLKIAPHEDLIRE